MWLTMPTAAQLSHSGHGDEHPTQLHGSLLVATLLIHGGGRLPWGRGKPQMEILPFLPKEPRVHSQLRAVPALLAGYRGT